MAWEVAVWPRRCTAAARPAFNPFLRQVVRTSSMFRGRTILLRSFAIFVSMLHLGTHLNTPARASVVCRQSKLYWLPPHMERVGLLSCQHSNRRTIQLHQHADIRHTGMQPNANSPRAYTTCNRPFSIFLMHMSQHSRCKRTPLTCVDQLQPSFSQASPTCSSCCQQHSLQSFAQLMLRYVPDRCLKHCRFCQPVAFYTSYCNQVKEV